MSEKSQVSDRTVPFRTSNRIQRRASLPNPPQGETRTRTSWAVPHAQQVLHNLESRLHEI